MILVDANLLLYAYQPRAAQHERSRRWLESELLGSQLVRCAWVTLWASIRIATSPRVFESALEHGATLYFTDRDFSRFPSLKCVNPLIEAG